MDGRGRLAQSLSGGATGADGTANYRRRHRWRRRGSVNFSSPASNRLRASAYEFGQRLDAVAHRLARYSLPNGAGVALSLAIILGSVAYGVMRGDHVAVITGTFRNARDIAANAAGFRITNIALSGNKQLNREEILSIAGVTGLHSMLFLDVAEARARLLANPWIGEATVQKLYPSDLLINITERQPFALWQKSGRVGVIAVDGTVLEPFVAQPLAQLPLVVGPGAETRAREFLDLLAHYPAIRDQVRASILVADRRWNLRLKNGLDIRLPEVDPAAALERLVALDRDKKILSRDLALIDLRLADRITVRLSDSAAQAREDALKDKTKQKKGGSA